MCLYPYRENILSLILENATEFMKDSWKLRKIERTVYAISLEVITKSKCILFNCLFILF